jgi:hypothetical protein
MPTSGCHHETVLVADDSEFNRELLFASRDHLVEQACFLCQTEMRCVNLSWQAIQNSGSL